MQQPGSWAKLGKVNIVISGGTILALYDIPTTVDNGS